MNESDKIDKQGYSAEDLLLEQSEARRAAAPAKRPTPRVGKNDLALMVSLAPSDDWADKRTTKHDLVLDLADLTKYADALEAERQPRPWPPPEEVRSCIGYRADRGEWFCMWKGSGTWGEVWEPGTHWLPIPPPPGVKG